jgi:hypothetical protein
MSTEQQRKMMECAAKACGKVIDKSFNPSFFNGSVIPYEQLVVINEQGGHSLWNPLTNPADCAEMCAKVGVDTAWFEDKVLCAPFVGYKSWAEFEDHDNSRMKAWMYAATMVAAKIGGYE